MNASCICVVLVVLLMGVSPSQASPRPDSLTATVGDVTVRIDGPKLWTISGIKYQGAVLGIDDSSYGTVINIKGVGFLGAAHFLNVPGQPGQVEKENVLDVQFFVDDKPIETTAGNMNVSGKSFRMMRSSKIRDLFAIESQLDVRDGRLIESSRIRTIDKEVDLAVTYPLMYAWTSSATEYLFGSDDGRIIEDTFIQPGGERIRYIIEKQVTDWAAVYDPTSGKGVVTRVLAAPDTGDTCFQFADAPNIYRKLYLMAFGEQPMPANFDGTYRMAIGFFEATDDATWKNKAKELAQALKKAESR